MKKIITEKDLNRREFLRGSSLSTLMMLMGGVAVQADEKKATEPEPEKKKSVGPSVNCGLIGCGVWGREILKTLAQLPNAPVLAISDTYGASLRRGQQSAPKAEAFEDYRRLLDQKEVKAVIIATPTHQHREIVAAALQAGKHVYCEAPLAHTIQDARAIALAAKKAAKLNFQAGLQSRSDPQRHFLLSFIRTGAMGKTIKARAQWHKKQSWSFTSPNPDREREINWRLRNETSLGLVGEIGIHQIDAASWIFKDRPVAVTGFGSIIRWQDGREIPDTVHAVFEYPEGILSMFDCTLANSFDADYEMYYGTDSALMIRENRAWMFKEVDAPLLGWEVYAKKDSFYKETGIALVANATKLEAQGENPVEEAPYTNTPLYYSLEAFIHNTNTHHAGVEDFTANFGENDQALQEYLGSLAESKLPAATFLDGYQAGVMVIKANQAILKRERIAFKKEWFELEGSDQQG